MDAEYRASGWRRALSAALAYIVVLSQTNALWMSTGASVALLASAQSHADHTPAHTGQQAGNASLKNFAMPDLSGDTMTYSTPAGPSSITLQEMFNSTDVDSSALQSTYGNADALTSTSESLIDDNKEFLLGTISDHSHPDMRGDPIWTDSDRALNSLVDGTQSLFTGCSTTETTTETTSLVHVPDLQLCERAVTPPGCKIKRIVTSAEGCFGKVISAGHFGFGAYAITDSDELYGTGFGGRLGIGDTGSTYYPSWVRLLSDVKSLTLGPTSTFALKNDGSLMFSGGNLQGSAGLGPAAATSIYTWTETFTDVREVRAFAYNSYAIRNDNTLWATGRNQYGEVGDGTTTTVYTWKKVLDNVQTMCGRTKEDDAINSSNKPMYAITTDGRMWTTGRNQVGQLGDGTYTDSLVWHPVLNNVTGCATAMGTTWAVSSDGTLWVTGDVTEGASGVFFLPATVNTWRAVLSGVRAVYAADRTSATVAGPVLTYDYKAGVYAVKTDNTLWVTGYNGGLADHIGAGHGVSIAAWWRQVETNVDRILTAAHGGADLLKKDNTLWVTGWRSCYATKFAFNMDCQDGFQYLASNVVTSVGQDSRLYADFDGRLYGIGQAIAWLTSSPILGLPAVSGGFLTSWMYTAGSPTCTPKYTETIVEDPPGCMTPTQYCGPAEDPSWVPTTSLADQTSTTTWSCIDADNNRLFSGVRIKPQYFAPLQAPLFPGDNPDPICYEAEARNYTCNYGSGTMCYTNLVGETVCVDVSGAGLTECAVLEADPACSFVSSEPVDESLDSISGTYLRFVDTYDCGYDAATPGVVSTTRSVTCPGAISCMGTECTTVQTEANADFGKAASLLSMSQWMQGDATCYDTPEGPVCTLFGGEEGECFKAGGTQNCCDAPSGISLQDYLALMMMTWDLAQKTQVLQVLAEAGLDIPGAWNSMVDYTSATWDAVTDYFTSAFESTAEQCVVDATAETASSFSWSAVQESMMSSVYNWTAETFGTTTAEVVFDQTVTYAADGTVEATSTSFSSTLTSVVNTVMYVYLAYQMYKLIVAVAYECTEENMNVNVKRTLKSCHYLGKWDTDSGMQTHYNYCCFSSPLARIVQENVRGFTKTDNDGTQPAMGLGWGTKKNPHCDALTVDQITGINWETMNLSEWVAILATTNQIPTSAEDAVTQYSMDNTTVNKSTDCQSLINQGMTAAEAAATGCFEVPDAKIRIEERATAADTENTRESVRQLQYGTGP